MTQISEEDVVFCFSRRKNRFQNKTGMMIGCLEKNHFWTDFQLCNHDYGPLQIDISTEDFHVSDFIAGFRLEKIEDIDRLGYNNSWMRYLNGGAVISVTPFDLEARLDFRILNRKTLIFSLDLHFYDEVYEHLTMPEDFERYITSHQRMLEAASDNQYKLYFGGKWDIHPKN
jgi:hypothetical protein